MLWWTGCESGFFDAWFLFLLMCSSICLDKCFFSACQAGFFSGFHCWGGVYRNTITVAKSIFCASFCVRKNLWECWVREKIRPGENPGRAEKFPYRKVSGFPSPVSVPEISVREKIPSGRKNFRTGKFPIFPPRKNFRLPLPGVAAGTVASGKGDGR